ncbi:hypothetical protein, partial [Bradyrhizobium uaiense]|uniref:hypothetical protein n=1 Tax=Bradyrhizobium uaiense TaxID=2594946 RepID=UPI0019D600F7
NAARRKKVISLSREIWMMEEPSSARERINSLRARRGGQRSAAAKDCLIEGKEDHFKVSAS